MSNDDDSRPATTTLHYVADGTEVKNPGHFSEDFTVVSVLTKTAFGKVLKAQHNSSGCFYAVTRLSHAADLAKTRRIRREAGDNVTAVEHPFLARVHFVLEESDSLYLGLEYPPGGDMFAYLQRHQTVDWHCAKFFAAEVALLISDLHSRDIRDIALRPEHFSFTAEGLIKLTEMSVRPKQFDGSPEYLAPEVLLGMPVTHAVDWYGLGVLLYELVVGMPPFYSDNVNEMYDMILKRPVEFPDTVPDELQHLLTSLLDRDAAARLQSLDEFRLHPFMCDLDFEAILAGSLGPPLLLGNEHDDVEARADFDNFEFAQ